MPRGAVYLYLLSAMLSAGEPAFDRWFTGPPRADIHWSVAAGRPVLTRHQRLASRVSIRVNGDEVVKRRGKSQLLMIIEIRDRSGAPVHAYRVVDLREKPYSDAERLEFAEYAETAYLAPGDYRISFALADLTTGERCLEHRKLHVAPLAGDPLPDSWRGMPAAEFAEQVEPPESWFQPSIASRLSLPLNTRGRIGVEIVMNVSISETSRAAQRRFNQALAPLVTALKVLSQIDVRNGSLSVSLLDLSRQRVAFRQEMVTKLDWPKMKPALAADAMSTIDAGSLERRRGEAQFFAGEVARLAAPERVVIVLSAPIAFPAGEDLRPVEVSGGRVFYIRYQTTPGRPIPDAIIYTPRSGRGAMPDETGRSPQRFFGLADQLLQTLKPLHPRLFEVWTPTEFRKALAGILHEISASY